MILIDPETVFFTGNQSMDDAHMEFAELLNQMETANNTSFPALFDLLLKHVEAHFENENALMQASGFPASSEHQAEHRRVIGELKQFKKRVDKGLLSFAKAYIKEKLPDWFRLHLGTMDAALAAHLKRQA